MEDYRLPASLVGMLKATRLTGNPRIQTDLQTATLAVTITWELASSTTKKKTTKPPASKKTAPAKKKKKSPSPSRNLQNRRSLLPHLHRRSRRHLHRRSRSQLHHRRSLSHRLSRRLHRRRKLTVFMRTFSDSRR